MVRFAEVMSLLISFAGVAVALCGVFLSYLAVRMQVHAHRSRDRQDALRMILDRLRETDDHAEQLEKRAKRPARIRNQPHQG